MSRIFAVLVFCFFIQTVSTIKQRPWIQWKRKFRLTINISKISGQEAEDDSSGNLLDKAGKLFNQHKGQLFSLLGLEEGKEEEFLTETLEKMNISSSSITKLTSSFTDQEAIKDLMSAFSNPDKLPKLLSDKTGMDQESINSFVQQVKDFTKR